jgi:anti-sigma B factor antagonist
MRAAAPTTAPVSPGGYARRAAHLHKRLNQLVNANLRYTFGQYQQPGSTGRYGARMHEPGVGDPDSDPGAGRGPAAEQLVRIDTGRVVHAGGEALVVTVAGEIDVLTVDRLRAAVAAGFEQLPDGATLVIDLTDVTFLGSPGLQALVDATRAAQRRREPLHIVVDHTRPVIRPIELAGLDDLLALFHTVDQAVPS